MMNYLDEVKTHVLLHGRAQGIDAAECRRVLGTIRTLEDDEHGWASRWTAEASKYRERGRARDAIARDNLARFPFAATEMQENASARAVFEFGKWARSSGVAENLAVEYNGSRTTAWFGSVDTDGPAPLVVVLGGIVSPKEQWGRLLPHFRKLGIAAVVIDLPGVGAHRSALYGPDSEGYVSAVVDAAATRMRLSGVYGLAMSFGGTVMLRAAAADPRIRGVVAVGSPTQYTFVDPWVQKAMPAITRRTLESVTGAQDLPSLLPELALDRQHLGRLMIPVHYIRSLRDEIVPTADANVLIAHLARAAVVDFDDVHGSPHHADAVRMRSLSALLEMIRPGSLSARTLSAVLMAGERVSLVSPVDLGRRVPA
ncbi:esterase FrsA [Rhodococcus pyridinivorans]|uniref:alpha/beta fold hydrolase n=2 Tax=Nocardiaceae TaxID=85025 RepID=UPI001E2C7408|nr:alpha/beta fold hydrolase [Rhodococcus pyridinivorans]UGQ57579.1 esterase FrsA [Rhodococcus pyridinivorans]